MFGRIFAIALNTYREALRARILLGLAGVAFAVALYSLVVGAFTLKSAPRVVSDLGAASISLFSVVVAILIAATSLYRELEQKTLFPILARPVRRGEYLVGKYAGTLLTLAVFVMADAGVVLLLLSALAGRSAWLVAGVFAGSAVVFGLAAWRLPPARTFGAIPWAVFVFVAGALLAGGAPDERRLVLASSLLTLLEVGIVTAVATLFSSFSTPFLSALLTLGVFAIGRMTDTAARLPVKLYGPLIPAIGKGVAAVMPNLYVYVPPRTVLTGEAAGVSLVRYLGMAAGAAVFWSVLLLALASFVFKRRDFL